MLDLGHASESQNASRWFLLAERKTLRARGKDGGKLGNESVLTGWTQKLGYKYNDYLVQTFALLCKQKTTII